METISSTMMSQTRSPTVAVLAVGTFTVLLSFLEEFLNEEVYVLLGFIALSAYLVQTKKTKKLVNTEEPEEHFHGAGATEVRSGRSQSGYNVRISDAMRDGDSSAAEGILLEMQAANVKPDVVTYNSFIQGYAWLGELRKAEAYVNKIEKEGLTMDTYTFAPLVKGYVRRAMESAGKISEESLRSGERWLSRMREAGVYGDANLYNNVLDLLAKNEQGPRVDALLFEMMEDGPFPNTEAFNAGIGVYGRLGQLDKMEAWHKRMKNSKVQADYHTIDKLIMGYGKAGQVEKAEYIFEHMAEHGVAPHANNFCSMLRIYGKASMFKKLEAFLAGMKEKGMRPGVQTYASILKSYSMDFQSDKVQWVLQQMRDDGIKPFKDFPGILSMSLQSFGQDPWRSNTRQANVKIAIAMFKEGVHTGAIVDKELLVVFERMVGTVTAEQTVLQLKLKNTGWVPKHARIPDNHNMKQMLNHA